MIRKFLTSVADVFGYDENDDVVFTAKTLLDSSIEVSLGSAPVRGGRGNQLQYIYYHTGEMKFTLTDTQWNLALLSSTVGSDTEMGNFYKEENVAVTGSAGSVSETPLAFAGTTIYGWATSPLGLVQKITLASDKSFTITGAETSGNWCIRYYTANKSVGKSLTVNANMIPKVVKLVMEAQLNSADVTTNKIGIVQIIAPTVTLSGAFTISMKADGVTTTPLTGTALAYTPTAISDNGCTKTPYYAKMIEVIDDSDWWDDVTAIAVAGGNYTTASTVATTLSVFATPSIGNAFKVPNADLTFTSSASSIIGVGLHTGVATPVTTGSATITAVITSASTISATVVATAS